jgi:hypothetical protein
MKVKTIVKQTINNVTPNMHIKRQEALNACVLSIMNGSSLNVTSMGRGIDSNAFEKHNIKRADRLCSNPNLHSEIQSIYAEMTKVLVGFNKAPVIQIDWSDLDAYGKHFLIRASLAFKGRSFTLYEECHPTTRKEKPIVHQRFIMHLKQFLPADCKPIIVTDAGFRGPWFKLIESLGWDFVGRVRNVTFCRPYGGEWFGCKQLYQSATSSPKALKNWQLNRTDPITINFVLYKAKPKGRHAFNRKGDVKQSGSSKSAASGANDPWLLVTSLNLDDCKHKKVVRIYASRMQIEEAFRDQKSSRFGIGLEHHYCNNIKRLNSLVLIGTLALFLLSLIGMATEQLGISRHFKANTVKKLTLSYSYIGRRMVQSNQFKIGTKDIQKAIHSIKSLSEKLADGF